MIQKLFTVIALFVFLLGCKTESKNPENLMTGGLKGPKVNLESQKVSGGKKIFELYCVSCHQKEGLGKAGLAPRINSPEFLGLANDDYIKKIVLSGRPGTSMIAFSALPDVNDNIDSLVAYLRSWQNNYDTFKNYNIDSTKKIVGHSKNGEKLFANYCASCHGAKGEGYSAGGSGPGIGLKGFLNSTSDEYIKKTIELGRAGTAMKPFAQEKGLAHLTDQQINDVVAYLRFLEK